MPTWVNPLWAWSSPAWTHDVIQNYVKTGNGTFSPDRKAYSSSPSMQQYALEPCRSSRFLSRSSYGNNTAAEACLRWRLHQLCDPLQGFVITYSMEQAAQGGPIASLLIPTFCILLQSFGKVNYALVRNVISSSAMSAVSLPRWDVLLAVPE